MIRMRWLSGLVATLVVTFAIAAPAVGQGGAPAFHPTKTVTIIVPYTPGGGTDAVVRLMAKALEEMWGQPVIVDNRTGAGGNVGAAAVASRHEPGRTAYDGPGDRVADGHRHRASGTLGGVAAKTREAMLLCEAAGFDVVLVETVGTGQSETAVADMTDFFLALMLPGAGDELQGIKKGLVELADMIAINKADGDNLKRAQAAAAEYRAALHILTPRSLNWTPPVLTYSALTGNGTPIVPVSATATFSALRAISSAVRSHIASASA